MIIRRENISTDALLLKGLRNGNHASFKKLYDLYSAHLFNYSFKLLKSKDAAEDIVQDTFLTVWNIRDRIKSSGSFKSMLFTIGLNSIRHTFNILSKENDLKDELLYNLSENSKEYSADNDYEELVKKLEKLLTQMPEKRKQVFIKKKIEGLKAKDIAIELNISVKTVAYHVAEAMKFLKKEFKAMGISGVVLLSVISFMRKK